MTAAKAKPQHRHAVATDQETRFADGKAIERHLHPVGITSLKGREKIRDPSFIKAATTGKMSIMTQGSSLRVRWAVLLGYLLVCTQSVQGIAQFVLKNGGNKCIKVDITRDLVVLLDFVAPDLQMVDPEENETMKRRAMTGHDGDEEDPKYSEDGLDSRYNARNRRAVSSR